MGGGGGGGALGWKFPVLLNYFQIKKGIWTCKESLIAEYASCQEYTSTPTDKLGFSNPIPSLIYINWLLLFSFHL